ncbi:retrovirus-related pol polyprotein from transposon TNT 1-94 [Tanacetum coccineum]
MVINFKKFNVSSRWVCDKDNPHHVYKHMKALYGLKQAPRTWYDMLSSFLISQDFSKGLVDPTLFIRRDGKELLLYAIKNSEKRCDIPVQGAEKYCYVRLLCSNPLIEIIGYHNGIGYNKFQCTVINKSAKALCFKTTFNISSSKHITSRFHFIKEHVKNGVIEFYFVNTEYQLADIFTKALTLETLKQLVDEVDE